MAQDAKKPMIVDLGEKEEHCSQGEAEDRQEKGKAPTYLEVGMTARPQGHSLNISQSYVPPFSAPEAPNELMSRLQAFLPQIAKANEELNNEISSNPEKRAQYEIAPSTFNAEEEEGDESTDDSDEKSEGQTISMDIAFIPLEDGDQQDSEAEI